LPTFKDALKLLEQKKGMERGTERIRRVLKTQGDPQEAYPIIMVAGTNGKTCTCYFIRQLLRKAGLRVGTFTSPHPENVLNEIQINGFPIPEQDFSRLILRFKDTKVHMTSFEIKVCAALEYFREREVNVAVMEMGMGGKEDAVNVRPPELAVITNVAMDHVDHLGETIEAITQEKGDIIPPNGILVTNTASPAFEMLQKIAEDRNAEVVIPAYEEYFPYLYQLMVNHHKKNAALAMEVVRRFSFTHHEIIPKTVSTLNLMSWAQELKPPDGRFQIIPLEENIKLILDGAHNPAGFRTLFGDLEQFLRSRAEMPTVVVMGILIDKDIHRMIPHTKNIGGKYFCTTPTEPADRVGDPELIAIELRKFHGDVFVAPNVKEAIESARLLLIDNGGLILVTGSLYTVANALRWVEEQREM